MMETERSRARMMSTRNRGRKQREEGHEGPYLMICWQVGLKCDPGGGRTVEYTCTSALCSAQCCILHVSIAGGQEDQTRTEGGAPESPKIGFLEHPCRNSHLNNSHSLCPRPCPPQPPLLTSIPSLPILPLPRLTFYLGRRIFTSPMRLCALHRTALPPPLP